MFRFKSKIWDHRVRKTVIVSLIAPLFSGILGVSAPSANAAFVTAGDGTCIQDVGVATGITVTKVGSDCLVTFSAPSNTTTSHRWTVPYNGTSFQILVVGGGGGGGADGGNGGGGGELRYGSAASAWVPSGGTEVTLQVGAGGVGGSWSASTASSAGTSSQVSWGGSARFTANPGGGGGGWTSSVVAAGGTGGSGGSGTDGQSATAVQSGCGSLSATQNNTAGNWYTGRWFLNGGSGAGTALTTTAPKNAITGSDQFYGGAGGGGWGGNVNSASVGPIYGLAGGGTVNNVSTSGGRGSNWLYIPGDNHTTSWSGASAGGQGVDATGGGGGGGNACDPTINGTATTNGSTKRTAGGRGGSGVIVIRYTPVLFTVNFDANGGSGSPSTSSASQIATSNSVTLASVGTLARSGYRFAGWNTAANGTGTNYAAGSTFTPTGNVTLYAQWNSTINYNGNTATSTRSIESTSAVSGESSTTLSKGKLEKGSPITNGLVLHLDAADPTTVSGSSWTNKVAGVSGAEAAATIVGSPIYNSTDGYFALDGSSQYFTLGSTNYYYNGTKNFSLSICYSPSDTNKTSAIMSRYNGSVAGTYLFQQYSDYLYAYREVSPWNTPAGTKLISGENYCVSETYDGSYIRVYINGILDATSALITGSVYDSTVTAAIGAAYDSNVASRFLKGKIYNAQIYNRALSASEIATNYQSMAPGQIVTKTNYTLGAWNTQSNGSGTSYGTVSTDLAALPTPYFRVSAENYSGGTLNASVGGSNLSITKNGSPVLNSNSGGGFGANARFPTISGATGDGFRLGNAELPNYTFCGMARYKDLDSGVRSTRGRIFANGSGTNWISGWYDRGTKNFYHDAWMLGAYTVADSDWHVVCDSGNKIFWDGVKLSVTNATYTKLPPLAINWGAYGDTSHFEFTEAIVYDQALTSAQINNIFRYFKNKFGLTDVVTSSQSAATFVPPTNFASFGDATLQATWVSQVTYDGNKQTSGTAPSPQTVTNSGGTVASVGTLLRSGYRFAGWNTAANGSGTAYPVGAALTNDGNKILYAQWVLPVALPFASTNPSSLSPYMRLVASDYDAVNKIWRDSSGNSRNVTRIAGAPTVSTVTGNGASKSFQTVGGGTSDKIYLDNDPISTNWTVFALSRYSTANNRNRIISGNYSAGAYQDSSGNWLIGQYGGKAALAHYNGWVSPDSTPADQSLSDWVMSTAYPSNYRYNGTQRGTSGGTAELPPLGINTFEGQLSDFQVAELIIFDRTLTASEIGQIEDYFDETYGLAYAKVGTYKTASTLAIATTIGGRSDTFTATNGLGNKTFSISPVVNGITLDTSTANGVAIVVSSLVPAGVYLETLTATDQAGATSTFVVNINVANPIKWSTNNSNSVTTTVGKSASLRLDLTGGLTGKIVTLNKPTTVPLSGITLDTSTLASSSYVTVNLNSAVLPGLYSLSLVVTDDTKKSSTQNVTVTVNNLPQLTFTPGVSDSTTTVIKDGLWLQYEMGKSFTGTGTTVVDLTGNNAVAGISSGIPYSSTLGGGSITVNGSQTLWISPGTIAASDALSKFYWIYPTAATGIIIATCDSGCVYHETELELVNQKLYARVWNLGAVSTQETITLNAWHYVGYIYDPTGTTSIYIDGKLSASGANSGTRGPPGNPQYDGLGYAVGTNMMTSVGGQFSFGGTHYYKRVLSASEVFSNFAATAPRYLGTTFPGLPFSGSASLATTQGVANSYSLFTATSGTGDKVISISPTTAGITLDTSTANTAILNIAKTVTATNATTASVYTETVTAVDSVSAVTNYKLQITVNPPITITPTTASTVTTTLGLTAYDTFTAAYGTGAYTFSNTASAYQSAFTLTKSTANVGVLTIANNLPVGTYTDTITVTDSVSAVTNYVLTVVVNPKITIAGATSTTVSTTIGKSTSLRINVTNGSGTRTLSYTSPNAGITIDSSTITSNYATLNVATTTPANTFKFAVTATDGLGVSATETFTVVVNKAPKITGPSVASSGLELNFDAGDPASYSGTGTTWNSTVGGKSVTLLGTSGLPTYSSNSGGLIDFNSTNLATQKHYAAGSIANTTLTSYTVEVWAKFASLPTGEINALVSDKYQTKINYELFYGAINVGNCVGVGIHLGHYNAGWSCSKAVTGIAINTWYHIVGTYDPTDGFKIFVNGILQTGASASSTVAASSDASNREIYIAKRHDASDQFFPGSLPVVRIYNRALTAAEALQNYSAIGNRYVSAPSGSDSVTVTAGKALSVATVLATDGTGDKTFTASGLNSGITVSSPAGSQFNLNLASSLTSVDSVTARTLYETVTATDSVSATTTFSYKVTVNPAVQLAVTSNSISTTSGINTYDTFTATNGTGTKTFALTGSRTTSGFTLTQANNVAVLKVESTANPGTYYETVTATDSLGATQAYGVTVIVYPGPTVSGITVLSATTGSSYRSPAYTSINGSGAKKFTMTSSPVNANIKIDTSTAGYAFITVASSGVSAGTYYETITVTDANGAIGNLPITLTVADPFTLSGNQTVNTTFGTSTTVGYSTSANGIYNIVTSDVCTSAKSTFIGNGTIGLNGVSYTVEEFLGGAASSCAWVVPAGVDSITALVVAGGGQGGEGRGGGGGAGGVLFGQLAVTAGSTINLQVGLGGSISTCNDAYRPAGCDGLDSSIGTTVIAKGGGGGGGHVAVTSGRSGGSGGGAGMNYLSESPTAGSAISQTYPVGWTSAGFAGGTNRNAHPSDVYRNTGGGGGAITAGFNGNCWTATGINGRGCLNTGGGDALLSSNAGDRPDGGEGLSASTTGVLASAVTLTGATKNYAGGGGGAVGIATAEVGGTYYSGPPGVGKSGGGNGANVTTIFGGNATPNSGSGGGGGVNADGGNRTGGNGASGAIVVRYVTPTAPAYNNAVTFLTNTVGTLTTKAQITMTVPDSLTVGTYTKTISIAGYDGTSKLGTATSYTVTINVAKATPRIAISLPGSVSTGKYGTSLALTATTSTAGTVRFKSAGVDISGCTAQPTVNNIATCNWTPTTVGNIQIDASLTPTDTTDYNSADASTFTLTAAKADTLTVTALDETLVYTGSTAVPTSPFVYSGLVSVDTITAISSMLYTGTANDGTSYSSTTPPTKAGSYLATPNYPTNASAISYIGAVASVRTPNTNYVTTVVAPGNFIIARAPNTTSLIYPTVNTNSAVTSPPANNYITFKTGKTDTPTTASKSGNGTISFSTLTSSLCSVDSATGVMSLVQAGNCQIKMSVTQGDNYLADSATATIQIAKGNRTISLTSTTSTLKYSDTATTVTTISDGALDGSIAYSLNSNPGCSIDTLSGVITATSGTLACTLNATIAEGTNFLTATTATALPLTIAKATAPIITIDSVTAVDYALGQRVTLAPTYRITGFKGTDAASLLTLTYNFVSNPFETFSYSDTRTPIDAGTYSIVPSALVMSSGLVTNYEAPNYAASAGSVTVNRIAQATVTIENVNGEVTVPFTLKAVGGNNPTGALTFTMVLGAGCTVTGNILTASAAGACKVRVTMAGNRNYLPVTSDTVTVSVRNFQFIPVFTFGGSGGTGVTISSSTPITKGADSCAASCVPTVTLSNPYEGSAGDVVILTGTYFTGATRVIFNIFTDASVFSVDTDTQITVQVPSGLTPGDGTIEVETPGGVSARYYDFTVLP